MTEFTDDPTAEGQRRAAAWRAHMEASSAAMTEASMKWHRADHDIVTSGQLGLYGNVTPQQQAAMVAAQRRVGDSLGAGRDLVAQGGEYTHHLSGPAPARADLRSTAAPPGFIRTKNPLDKQNQ